MTLKVGKDMTVTGVNVQQLDSSVRAALAVQALEKDLGSLNSDGTTTEKYRRLYGISYRTLNCALRIKRESPASFKKLLSAEKSVSTLTNELFMKVA